MNTDTFPTHADTRDGVIEKADMVRQGLAALARRFGTAHPLYLPISLRLSEADRLLSLGGGATHSELGGMFIALTYAEWDLISACADHDREAAAS